MTINTTNLLSTHGNSRSLKYYVSKKQSLVKDNNELELKLPN